MPPTVVDIEAVKHANPIEQVVEETEQLVGTGRYRKGAKHDSLVVDTKGQAYFWNSMGSDDQGDVITWVQKHRGCADFKDAVEWLCRRGNLPSPEWSGGDAKARLAARARDDALTVAARWMVRQLRASAPAQAYAKGRGWTEETINTAGLGFSGEISDRKDLLGELAMHGHEAKDSIVRAIMKLPPGMLVYPHVRSGRVRYLSARSITDKRHYNLDSELAGERQLYLNSAWAPTEERVVIVEGQADAVTLAQWGVAAIALAGVSAGDELERAVQGHKRVYVGLDKDKAGLASAMKLARALGPLTRFLAWPAKDANDWLKELGRDPEPAELGVMLDDAQTFVERVCIEAGKAPAAERREQIPEAFRVIALLEPSDVALYRKDLCKHLHLDQRQFENLLKVARRELGQDGEEEEIGAAEEIIGGYFYEHLLELIYDPTTNETKLAVRGPGGALYTQHIIELGGVRYQAAWPSAMMTRGVVLFPSALGPEVPPLELRQRIQRFIHKYLDIPANYERLAAYYVMFTWVYDAFTNVPYLRALGDSGTGKSRFLDTIGYLCYRPMRTMGATTASPIFRLLDRYKGTLILDEADWAQSDTTADIIKIINVGFAKGTPVLRSGSDRDNFEPEAFNVFGPKILGTRKPFQDDATEKRCLTHRTGSPTTRPDIPLMLESDFHAEAVTLRNMLLTYRLKHWQPEIKVDYSLIDRQAVEPRLNQIILGLITMVDDQALRDDIKRLVRDYNDELISDRSMTVSAKVLEALVEVMNGGNAGVSVDGEPYWDLSAKRLCVVVNRLIDAENENENDEEPEGDGAQGKGKFKAARGVTNRRVTRVCREEFHLEVKRTTWGTKSMGVVWDEQKVKELCARYGVEWQQPTYQATAAPAKPPKQAKIDF